MADSTINFTLVSPSKVGSYAACSMRLVHDSDNPATARTSNKWADFGTVCHYMTQYKLGCAPPDEPTEAQMSSAKLMRTSEAAFEKAIDSCSDLAVASLPPLPVGVRWLSEFPASDPTLLPLRRSRKNPEKVEGFGGSIDLLASDRSLIVDLKFVSKQPTYLKVEYLWQLASYAMLTGVTQTMILWVMTDAKSFYNLTIDWADARRAPFLKRVRAFIERVGHKNFREYVYPVEGEHCEYCEHKHRCALKSMPDPMLGLDGQSGNDDNEWLDKVMAQAAAEAAGVKNQPLLL